jgi:PPOX class probable F420-dependent enzyme
MTSAPVISEAERLFLADGRTATLATIAPDGAPRLVPICFALADDVDVLYSPLDDKPKDVGDPRDLARVRDILARPDVSLLVHHWSEDWSALGWLRVGGRASLLEPGAGREHMAAVRALRGKYPQYAEHRLESRPIIRVEIVSTRSWGSLG